MCTKFINYYWINMHNKVSQLQKSAPAITFSENQVLAPFTTVKIGGPAQYFCTVNNEQELVAACTAARTCDLPVTILGWGANTLIADTGIKGLVIRNQATAWKILDSNTKEQTVSTTSGTPTHTTLNPSDTLEDSPLSSISGKNTAARYQSAQGVSPFSTLDYSEENQPQVLVEVESGAALPILITQLISQGITGLQWYAKIPATLGGAIVNNIHGGSHYIAEVVRSVKVLTPDNQTRWLSAEDLDFEYDFSRFHYSKEIILTSKLSLYAGDQEKAKNVVSNWARTKAHQPQQSLGCVFQNISLQEQQRLDLPTPGVGYIIDVLLGLKGKKVGGAEISTQHAAFIVNCGDATASDYLALVQLVLQQAQEKLQLQLKPEIFFQGFSSEELAFLSPNQQL